MPSGGRRSTNGSWRGGSARCTAATTLSYCCGPVIASTPGYRAVIFSGSAPMHPVTITLADGGERFRLGAVEKAAGVDHCEVGAGMGTSEFIALRAQAGHDALAVDQRLRAAERDETHPRYARRVACGMSIFHGEGLPERAVGSKRPGLSALVPDRRH